METSQQYNDVNTSNQESLILYLNLIAENKSVTRDTSTIIV